VASHDGFTLHDLVSYNDKHNEANGEDNRDGHNHNLSWNCGVEGPTDDLEVRALREQQKRNLLATLFLSQGVPMLLSGDELGRTQGGNNNAYAQDNEISWLDWTLGPEQEALIEFVRELIALRRAHPSLRRRDFFGARGELAVQEARWLRPDAQEMSEAQWHEDFARCLGLYIAGGGLADTDARGQRLVDDDFLLLFNAHHEDMDFTLPAWPGLPWCLRINTALDGVARGSELLAGASFRLAARSLAVLLRPTPT
jgi:isoamylase